MSAQLRLSEELLPAADTAVVRVAGSFDLATLPDYERLLRRLREQGRVKVVVDLAGLDYVSSSGLGSFLGTLDPFREKGGDLVFTNLSERVQKIFRVVGFHRLLTVAASEAEALARFGGKAAPAQLLLTPGVQSPHSGEPFDLEILAADGRGMAQASFRGEVTLEAAPGIVAPSRVGPFRDGVWHGKVVLTGPGRTLLSASAEAAPDAPALAGSASLDVREDKPPAVLPLTVACPGCRKGLEIRAFNVYRCKGCDEIYFVDKWAHAITLKPGRKDARGQARRCGLFLPAEVGLLGAARAFLTAALREQGVAEDAVSDVEMAADEAVTNVVEHAYGFDAARTIHLELAVEPGRIEVRVKDQGKAFDPLAVEPVNLDRHVQERRTGGLGVHLIRSLMDGVEYRREGDFNVLILTKKTGA